MTAKVDRRACGLAALACAWTASPVWAQEQTSEGFGDIVVTAQRRSESLQLHSILDRKWACFPCAGYRWGMPDRSIFQKKQEASQRPLVRSGLCGRRAGPLRLNSQRPD